MLQRRNAIIVPQTAVCARIYQHADDPNMAQPAITENDGFEQGRPPQTD
jgi:hypothetical protein